MQCVVVAERNILKKTLDKRPRLFTFPHSLNIEVAFEEPQRLPESDQLRYLPSKTIATRDLHSAASTRQTLIQDHAPPRKMTVSVTDESCPTRDKALQINVFYPTIAQMPKIKNVGDIIRFHKVKIQQYQDKTQGVGMSRATRHLVLRERDDGKLEQLAYSDSWTFEPSDEERTRKLIKWSKTSLAEDTTLPDGCLHAPKLLAELQFAEGFIDLVVRVFHLDDSEEPVRLIVWDGSGNAADSDMSLVQALKDRNIAVPASGLLKEVIMASCWSLVRDMGFVDGMLTHWCRFRNLAIATDEPIPGTVVTPGRREVLRFREVTSFALMPELAFDVQLRLSLMASTSKSRSSSDNDQLRMRSLGNTSTEGPLGSSNNIFSPVVAITVIPAHIQKNIPVTSLREILSSPQTPRKFHCCARVRSIWPTDIAKICKPKSGSFIYSFALNVEEGNDSMNIIVYGKDAVSAYLHQMSGILLTAFVCLCSYRNTFFTVSHHVISEKAPALKHCWKNALQLCYKRQTPSTGASNPTRFHCHLGVLLVQPPRYDTACSTHCFNVLSWKMLYLCMERKRCNYVQTLIKSRKGF
ncbi:Hypothetical protein PHPALM_38129 [Phytophthora palmivora]|uniref:Telomeric single stranded DNA binding POT1/Cdc13 domain-containing protein n=1 Tax=Phytophthora palmivora TaxID=4796 RepID=A0A2P4WVP5_9STRA|nr:Hypothetical protein PHPALM_38129 [Phytophthora palmivora]